MDDLQMAADNTHMTVSPRHHLTLHAAPGVLVDLEHYATFVGASDADLYQVQRREGREISSADFDATLPDEADVTRADMTDDPPAK